MKKILYCSSLSSCHRFFFLYILSLLQAFPKIIALPLLFGIIVITLSYFNYKNDSKGFNFKISRKLSFQLEKTNKSTFLFNKYRH